MSKFVNLLNGRPVIPGIKRAEDLEAAMQSSCSVVFLLYGNLMNIEENIRKLKLAGKTVFVNIDLIDGFSGKQSVLDYMRARTQADGIVSSKATLLRYARSIGFLTILRIFAIDSQSYDNIPKQLELSRANALNIVPGWAKLVAWASQDVDLPIIAAGLICDEEDGRKCLRAGAAAICSTNRAVWEMNA